MTMNKILIYAEVSDDKVNPVFYELLSKAKELLPPVYGKIGCILLGESISGAIDELRDSGVDEIFSMDDSALKLFNMDYYCEAIYQTVIAFDPDLILFGATSIGEELAPTIGLKLKTGVAAHCIDIHLNENGELAQLVPAFGGKVIGEIFTPNTRPKIVSIKPGILPLKVHPKYQAKISNLSPTLLGSVISRIQALEIILDPKEDRSIEKSEFVVCAGYGLASKEISEDLKTISSYFNGSIGYTRPAIDAGMAPNETNMIGTSGKSIKPKIYLGIGVSGSTHHICGMKDSEIVIGVNTDHHADLFELCDYKAVCDGEKVIKELADLISTQSIKPL